MPRPLNDSPYIYGLHDPGGQQIMLDRGVPGWVLVTVAIGHDPNDLSFGDDHAFQGDYRALSASDLGVIVRLNNGYGISGTLPPSQYYDNFARRCANFAGCTQGAHIWIVGNQPNHPAEWPGADWDWSVSPPQPKSEDTRGEPITPERYVRCYQAVRQAIHSLTGHGSDLVLMAPVAPWNNLLTYAGNTNGDWVRYFADVLGLLGAGGCDGLALHTFTHGSSLDLITSDARLDPPFGAYRFHFRCYQDFMAAIPSSMAQLPVFITETDQGDDAWRNENTGWVRAAYAEIDGWNQAHAQKIRSLILYRWPQVAGDRWGIEGKQGVIDDFKGALAAAYRWDVATNGSSSLSELVADLETRTAALVPSVQQASQVSTALASLGQTVDNLSAQEAELQPTSLLAQSQALLADLERIENTIEPPANKNVSQPELQDVRLGLPLHASLRYPIRSLSVIKRIVVHHTATKDDVTPQGVAQAQVSQGKAGITYHFLVTGKGTIYWTESLQNASDQTTVPAVNADAIGVALAGSFNKTVPTEAQVASAAALIAWLLNSRGLGIDAVYGRCEVETRKIESPGTQWLQGAQYKQTLLAAVQAVLQAAPVRSVSLPAPVDPVAQLQTRTAELQSATAEAAALRAQVASLQGAAAGYQARLVRVQELLRSQEGGVQKPEMVDVVDSLPKNSRLPPYSQRNAPVSLLVVHHTDTPATTTVQQLAQYHAFGTNRDAYGHVLKSPWPGIGYHFVIGADGVIYQCQRETTSSYHVGDLNNSSVGVSLIGRFMRTNENGSPRAAADQLPTDAQMRSAAHLLAWLLQEHGLSTDSVKGHREVSPQGTSCPGDQWLSGANWKATLLAQIKALQADQPAPAPAGMEHYLLFWDHGDHWAEADWHNAQPYIEHFRPSLGFSVEAAMLARHVTIVGSQSGVSADDEARLVAAGVDVHRLDGITEAATKALLDDLVAKNTPWPPASTGTTDKPAAAPTGTPPASEPPAAGQPASEPPAASAGPACAPDEWTVPDDWQPMEPEQTTRSLVPVLTRIKIEPII